MRKLALCGSFILVSLFSFSQNLHLGVFGGASAYSGDLVEKFFPKKLTNGVIGITANYELQDQIFIRAGFNYSVVGGDDKYSKDTALQHRNLSFETSIAEFSLTAEYYIFNLYNQKFSPYFFAGLAIFHFNPYAYDRNRQQVFLKPLSTEGQGLSQYPDRKPYSLTQLAIPFGGGIKYAFNDNVRLGLELGLRKLFTDYLDDVSTTYADYNDLLAAKGQLAVDMAYRGYEVTGGNPNYPAKNITRGGEKFKDWYYFAGLHLTFRIGSGGSGLQFMSNKRKYGCPNVPQ
jgi:opacity protein-like surface antigen